MAKFFNHNGVICLRKNTDEERLYPVPDKATDVLVFDATVPANAAIIAAFDADCNGHDLSGGVLFIRGEPVVFAGDSQRQAELDEFSAKLESQQTTAQEYLAKADTATIQELTAQVKRLTEDLSRLYKIVAQLQPTLEKQNADSAIPVSVLLLDR